MQGVEKICTVLIYWGRIKDNFVGSTCLPVPTEGGVGRNADVTQPVNPWILCFWGEMEIRYCEVCGAVLDQHFFEFCHNCRKYLCFDLTGKEMACAKSHPSHIGYYYCQICLDDLFLCGGCGQYKTRRGRFPLKDHLCEECSRSSE